MSRRGRRSRRPPAGDAVVSRSPAHSRRWTPGRTALALWALAAAVRLLFLFAQVDSGYPFSTFYYGDSRAYREFALALLDGRAYDQGIPFHPPLFAWLLAAVIDAVGARPALIRALLSLLAAGAVPLTYLLGLRLFDRATALVASLLATFSFALCVLSVSPNNEILYIPLLVAQAWATVALSGTLAPPSDPLDSSNPPAETRAGGGRSPGSSARAQGEPSKVRPDPARSAAQAGAPHPKSPQRPPVPGDRPPPARAPISRILFKGPRFIYLAVTNGLLIGLGSLTRAEHLAFLLLVPLALVLARPLREQLARAVRLRTLTAVAVVVAVALAVVAPWTLHNRVALARFNRDNPGLAEPLPTFVLVTSYGAVNFALANHPGAQGGFDPRPIVGAQGTGIDLHDPGHLDFYLHGYRRGLDSLAADPARALRLFAAKLGIAVRAFGLGFGAADRPAGLAGVRRPVDLFTPDRWWLVVPALALLLAGVWLARDRRRSGAVVGLAALHKVALCLAFFGYARLFAHLLPFAFLLQAWAAVWLVRRLPARGRRLAAGAALAVAALLAVELVAAVASPRNYVISGSSDARGMIVQDAEVRIRPKG